MILVNLTVAIDDFFDELTGKQVVRARITDTDRRIQYEKRITLYNRHSETEKAWARKKCASIVLNTVIHNEEILTREAENV